MSNIEHVDDKVELEHQEREVPVLTADDPLGQIHSSSSISSNYQHLSVLPTVRLFKKSVLICMLCAFSACSDGYQYILPNQLVAMPGFIDTFGVEFHGKKTMLATTISAWSAIYTAAYIVVLFAAQFPMDILGRKWCLLFIQLFLMGACLLEMFAKTWPVWAIAKLLNGFSVGLCQATVQAYISEIAPTKARGGLLAAYSLFWSFGQFGAALTSFIIRKQPASHWRRAVYAEWIFSGLMTIIWFFLPESPRWYSRKGRHEKAKEVLLRLNGNIEGYDVEHEYAVIVHEIEDGKALTGAASQYNVFSIFRGTNLRRTLIAFTPFALQQWIGSVLIYGQSAYFFQQAGLANAYEGTISTALVSIFATCLSFYLTERFGRRFLLLTGGTVCVVCMFVIGGVGFVSQEHIAVTGPVTITFTCLWVLFYSGSFGPLGYAFLAETSTLLLRAKTTSMAAGMTGMANLILNYCTPLMLSATAANWGIKGTALFYAGTGAVGMVITYFFIPETKGRSYIELDELFARKIPARQFAKTKTAAQNALELQEGKDVPA